MSEFEYLKKLFSEPNEQSQGLGNSDALNFTKSTLEKILEGSEVNYKTFQKTYPSIAKEIKTEISAVQTTIELINRFLETIET